jgi:hypothetical protein
MSGHVTAAIGSVLFHQCQKKLHCITVVFLKLHYRQTSPQAAPSPMVDPSCKGKKRTCNARSSRGVEQTMREPASNAAKEKMDGDVQMKTY